MTDKTLTEPKTHHAITSRLDGLTTDQVRRVLLDGQQVLLGVFDGVDEKLRLAQKGGFTHAGRESLKLARADMEHLRALITEEWTRELAALDTPTTSDDGKVSL